LPAWPHLELIPDVLAIFPPPAEGDLDRGAHPDVLEAPRSCRSSRRTSPGSGRAGSRCDRPTHRICMPSKRLVCRCALAPTMRVVRPGTALRHRSKFLKLVTRFAPIAQKILASGLAGPIPLRQASGASRDRDRTRLPARWRASRSRHQGRAEFESYFLLSGL